LVAEAKVETVTQEKELYRETVVTLDTARKLNPVQLMREFSIDVDTVIREYPEVVGFMYADTKNE
jgi:hypothetical protein